MATGGNISSSDEIIVNQCCICAKKNVSKEAEKYCVECKDYYCEQCSCLHTEFSSVNSGHTFLDKSDFSASGIQKTLPPLPTERCSVHKAKLLDMYCGDHDKVVCGTCIALNHRSCKDIYSIPDEVDHLYKKSISGETRKDLSETKTSMENIKEGKERLLADLEKHKRKAADSITHFRKEMKALFKKLENEALDDLEEEYRKIRVEIGDHINEASKYIDDLQQLSDKVKRSAGNKVREFVSVKLAMETIDEAKEVQGLLVKAVDVEVSFNVDSKLKTQLQQLRSFGRIKLPTTVYKVNRQCKIKVNQEKDGSACNVVDSCLTPNGFLLLTDYANQKLKRADLSSMSIKDHLDLEVSPHAICQTSEDEVAVTLVNRKVQFVSVGDKMTTTEQLQLDHGCWGVAYKDGKLFIPDQSSAVYIHDINGTVLHKFTTDGSGNAIFSNCRHITLSTDGKRMHVADYDKGLITLDMQGNYESTYNDPDVPHPEGVDVDERDNIFVTGWGDSKIVEINKDLNSKLGELGTVTNGHSVRFYPQENMLVVTMSDSDTADVYELI